MIIDAHCHLGQNQHINATADQLIASMDASNVDHALVFGGHLNDCSNEYLFEQLAPHADRLHAVAAFCQRDSQGLLMSRSHIDQLAELYQQKKIVAVKFYTGYDHYFPRDVRYELSFLEEVGCPAIFHSGDCLNSVKKAKLKYSHPVHLDEVAVDFPKMNFIIAHMGFPWQRDAAEVCYKNANVFADVSGFVYGDFTPKDYTKFRKVVDEFVDIAGSDKLMFGSDWPISNQSSYRSVLEQINHPTTVVSTGRLAQQVFNLAV